MPWDIGGKKRYVKEGDLYYNLQLLWIPTSNSIVANLNCKEECLK